MKKYIYTILVIVLCNSTCLFASEVRTDKFTYYVGDTVSFSVESNTLNTKIQLRDISVKGEPLLAEVGINEQWVIPDNIPLHGIGLYLKSERMSQPSYSNYFRIIDSTVLTTYEIERLKYKDLDVLTLDGGMSAEYAIQKSLSNLCGALSHTWKIGPGGGPNPVWGTPDFLVSSIRETISLYNEYLGENKPIETVIISTGIPAIPYLSATMDAVVLPLHFLVSVNAIKEVETILDSSSKRGYPCYATLGYDASMDNVGVAWVKMLDLPEEYIKFINDHQVKNVIIAGIDENLHSESFCRKLIDSGKQNEEYSDGSLYILYTHNGSDLDIKSISSHLKDYDPDKLEEGRFLSDWESGVLDIQIKKFSKTIQKNTKAAPYSLISPTTMVDMYNFAVNLSLSYLEKNNIEVNGVVLNEYLISHPKYELLKGTIPLLYWQFNPASSIVSSLDNYIIPTTFNYFPETKLKEKNITINARIGKYNLERELINRGYHNIEKRLDKIEEVWDMSDGINAPCEFIANDILCFGLTEYKKQIKSLSSLTMTDLQNLMKNVSGVVLKSE